MDRFDGTNKAVDLYGSGKHGYKDSTGTLGTGSIPNATSYNSFQEEIMAVIEAWGLTGDSADLGQLSEALGDGDAGMYGDGSTGDLSTSGDVTLTADAFYDDLTVNTGDTIFCDGFILHVKGKLVLLGTGTISNDGVVGQAGAGGGAGGASAGGNTLRNGTDGAAGGGGASNGNPSSIASDSFGGDGGDGGDGSGGTWTGGAGAASAEPAAAAGTCRALPEAASGRTLGYDAGGGPTWVRGGSGGGGGADQGGGGGGSGGLLVIRAKRIEVPATAFITANGGDGGVGDGGPDSGGGGGGGGGVVILIYRSLADVGGTIEAAGGAGGAKSGTGSVGAAGTAGLVLNLIA